MDDKLKVLWNLDVLVKMCRSKSDGPSLRVEETEIKEKIKNHQQEIDEIRSLSDEDSYDTSAEMADRNIEIITKKQLQSLKNELKEKNKELNNLKDEESNAYESTNLLRNNKASYEKYIISIQERLTSTIDQETIGRYNDIIKETDQKIEHLIEELNSQNDEYETIQNEIISLTEEISNLEDQIDKKKKLLEETQNNLKNKETYIDKSKREKNNKRINDLEQKIEELNKRLEEIEKDPKYIETKIKDIINSEEEPIDARKYLIDLLNIVIRQPYINVPDDNNLEEELLRATQARDTFANEVEQKTYNILEARTPEKARIEFLESRIEKWHNEQEKLQKEIDLVDKDEEFHYKDKYREIASMISIMKNDLAGFQKAYDEAPESNISLKAGLKVFIEEKKEDIVEAEKIATLFRNDESGDIEEATKISKYKYEEINNKIRNAQEEISNIRNRLMSKKAGLIDITSRNKDKDTLKELAQIVIDLKHRRQFPETPLEIIKRLEDELHIDLLSDIDYNIIEQTNTIIPRNYEEYISQEEILDEEIENAEPISINPDKRGIKVVTEIELDRPEIMEDDTPKEELNTSNNEEETIFENSKNNEEIISQEQSEEDLLSEKEEETNKLDNSSEEILDTVNEESNSESIENQNQELVFEENPENEEITPIEPIDINNSEEFEVISNSNENENIEDNTINENQTIIEENAPTENTPVENSLTDSTETNSSENISLNNENSETIPINSDNSETLPINNENSETLQEEQIYLSSDNQSSNQNEEITSNSEDLSINNIFNINTSETNQPSEVSSENLSNELDNYINNLDNKES